MTATIDPRAEVLLSAWAVRQRCRILYAAALAGRLEHFTLYLGRLDEVADYVLDTMRHNYPTLDVPFHARWRHFSAGGIDRWSEIAPRLGHKTKALGRAAFDLAIVSVLLDAGSGAKWKYHEVESGKDFARSEGLGVASYRMFAAGEFARSLDDKYRCDAAILANMGERQLGSGFQVQPRENPLNGLEGRVALLNQLGKTCLANPAVFDAGDGPRPGGLFDVLVKMAGIERRLPAARILETLLIYLGPIWPGRLELFGTSLGDSWHHPMVRTGDAADGIIPFHKLSQWLAYSLIEPLQWCGIDVVEIDGLTGLAEYRNGGLLLDMGLIALKNPDDTNSAHEPGSTLVVEWRALTVCLLDLIAEKLREKLELTAEQLPLAKVLEGGTWAAGRRIAAEKRKGGGPPLTIISDGTVF
ncbi:MAG: URC4/urg3 family protein [Bosea sp. (in: a-proteobacteria)]